MTVNLQNQNGEWIPVEPISKVPLIKRIINRIKYWSNKKRCGNCDYGQSWRVKDNTFCDDYISVDGYCNKWKKR